jgi:hypothetical protein
MVSLNLSLGTARIKFGQEKLTQMKPLVPRVRGAGEECNRLQFANAIFWSA